MLYSDLNELKSILGIDRGDTSEDRNLLFYIEMVSSWIEELLNRPGFTYKSRTEYYDGTGTQKLQLRSRPVFITPTIQVYGDESAYWGSVTDSFNATTTSLTYGTDFALRIDQENGTSSRSGILIRIGDYWNKRSARVHGLLSPFLDYSYGSYKIIYTAGYSVDTLPPVFRLACNMLIARLRYVMPLAVELSSESYEERSISVELKPFLEEIKIMLLPYRNWKF